MGHAAILLATTAAFLAGQAQAQVQNTEASRTTYSAADFSQYAPENASDMVQRLPGFSIIEADGDLRGYAGARGNVLIDGAWPTSKRDDIDDLLARIPAASVERIELIRGGAGIDMAGYSAIANVVRRHDAATETAIEGGGIVSTEGWAALQGQFEHARRFDEGSVGLIATFTSDLDDDSGAGVIRTRAPGSDAVDINLLDVLATKSNAEVGADWRQKVWDGQFTSKAALRGERSRVDTSISDAAGSAGLEIVGEAEDFLEADISAHFEKRFGDRWRLEALASQRLSRLDGLEQSDDNGETGQFAEKTDTGESIGRIELAYDVFDNLKLSAGLEGAFNFLESRARLEEDGTPVILPGSDVRIEEKRAEASFDAVWKPWDSWVLEAGIRFEDSVITQTGDTSLQRDFSYAKPRVSADWAVDEFNDLRLAFTREVSQLDFGDFVASASLDTGTVSAGNVSLEPAKTSRWTAAWERRLAGEAALTVTWTHESIADVIDRTLVTTVDDQFDAPGNIGDGRAETLKVDFATPLDALGISGGQFRSSVLWRSSVVTDPVTGDERDISKENPIEASVSLIQDVPGLRLNWGVDIDHIAERETSYGFDEIVRSSEDASWTLFAEWRFDERWALRAEASDLFGRDFSESRTRYEGARSTNPIEVFQDRERKTPGYVTVTIRHRMGG